MKGIMQPGLTIGVNSSIIHIDTRLWTTQALLAKKLGLTQCQRNAINNKLRRGTIPSYYIEQLDIRLIPNVNNINELGMRKKKL